MVQKKLDYTDDSNYDMSSQCLAHAHSRSHVSFSIKAGGHQSPRTLQVIKTLIRQESMLPFGTINTRLRDQIVIKLHRNRSNLIGSDIANRFGCNFVPLLISNKRSLRPCRVSHVTAMYCIPANRLRWELVINTTIQNQIQQGSNFLDRGADQSHGVSESQASSLINKFYLENIGLGTCPKYCLLEMQTARCAIVLCTLYFFSITDHH